MIRQPQSCPICGRLTIEPLLDKFHITADGEGSKHDVNALAAFMCAQEGHIFFVRVSDLERADPFRVAGGGR